ncbi:ABC transporter permease [Spiroplasma sp. AdecLV25b]|uniref:ABC transporter permease n=1 Tax=Spiroplasma sp. AdecLV25b TaxID=3027162 RepID=UPI0027E11B75|nr:ABC transporter permease [Spiroplasma sp. AdecLV25b]
MIKIKLLFKNNFKNTTKNKIQLVSLVILVFLSSLVFSIIETSKTRVTNSYNDFIAAEQSNQHDFIVDFSNTSYVVDGKDNFTNVSNLEERQNAVLDDINQKLKTNNAIDSFTYGRVEARTFYAGNNNQKILKAVTLNPEQQTDKFIVTQGMPLSLWSKYQQAVNRYSERWVYLNSKFAANNNIKINDIIRLQSDNYGHAILVKNDLDISKYQKQDINQWLPNSPYASANWFRVVGFGASADLITPIIDATHPIPDMKNQGLVYLDPILFGLEQKTITLPDNSKVNIISTNPNQQLVTSSSSDREVYYVGKFYDNKNPVVTSTRINQFLNSNVEIDKIKLGSHFVKIGDANHPLATYKDDHKYSLASRITFLETTLKTFSLGSYLIISTTLLLSVFALVLVLKKQIENTRIQNGILRSLGYHKHNIILSYFSYPLMIALIGGISGYVIGLASQQFVMMFFQNYFNFVFQPFAFTITSLMVCVFAIFILLSLVTTITCAIMMLKNPVVMINGDMINATFMIKQKIKKKITFKNNFNSRFKAALFSNSIGKMTGVSLTMIVVTALIAATTTIPMILQDNLKYSYIGDNYQTKIEYYNPTYNIPTSFYKTYDPSQPAWTTNDNSYYMHFADGNTNMIDNLDQLMNQYQTGKINSETYSPTFNATDLTSLLYKNISKQYLTSNKITIPQTSQILTPIIISSIWSDYHSMGLDNFNNKSSVETIVGTYPDAQKNVKQLDLLRSFYLKYRTTIGLDLQNPKYFSSDKSAIKINDNPDDFFTSLEYLNKGILPGNDLTDGHLTDEKNVYTPFSQIVNDPVTGYDTVERLTYDIYNWYKAYFINNIEQGFMQGIYSQAPDSLRATIAQNFKNPNANYNILFGVVPYNPVNDDLGTYFNASYSNQNFKVYGIKQNSKTQKLTNNSSDDLLLQLYNSDDNGIILNASLAKLLNVAVGQTITLNQSRNVLKQNNQIINPNSWDTRELSASDPLGNDSYTNSKYLYSTLSGSHLNDNVNWINKDIVNNNQDFVLKSNINPTNPTPVTATSVEKDASSGSLIINSEKVLANSTYVVKGITNQYGDNKAWVKETQAEKVAGYNEIKPTLFQIFLKEWTKPYDVNASQTVKSQVQVLNSSGFATNNLVDYQAKYNDFISKSVNDPIINIWQQIFNNEYPVFNYKLSQSNVIDDLTNGISTSQVYGDYSVNGLVGGSDISGNQYNAYKISSVNNLLPITTAQGILQHIYQIINTILFVAIIIACLLALLIIILTSNVIIAENLKVISTMKVLGYSNKSITKLVLGIYFPIVVLTTIIGFLFGWGLLLFGTSFLLHHAIVIPLIMKWWLPLISIVISYLLYSLAYLMSWKIMTKVNSLDVITAI